MKRSISILGIIALACVIVATAVCLFTPTATRCDLHFRLAEVDCIRQGVDPYRVWNEETIVKPYYSNNPARKSIPAGCNEMISVYVPWEYTLMLPFSFFGKNVGWWLYSTASEAALLAFCFLVFYLARKQGGERADAVITTTIPLLIVAHGLWSNLQVGNHMTIVLLATGLMAYCLNRNHDVAAGVCWALIMIKPQIGLIFAIPLALRMRIITAVIAISTCLILSIYPTLNCHASFFDMVLEPSAASAFAFEGCGTWPRFLCGQNAGSGDIIAGTFVGIILCAVMTWLVRKEKDWFVYLMPAAITSCCWTYTQAYSHVMGWFVAFVLTRELIHNPKSKFLWMLAVLSVFSLTRWFLAWHGLCAFAGWRFPMSEYAFRCVDSLNSTLSLSIAFALCLWLRSKSASVLPIQQYDIMPS